MNSDIEIIHLWVKETYKDPYLSIKDDYLVMYVGKHAVRIDITIDGIFIWLTKPGHMENFKWTDPQLFKKMKRFIDGY